MELLLRVSFCLLTFFGKTFGDVIVTEGSDVRLNCSLPGKDLTHKVFDWKKDAQQEVFLYANGDHYNNKRKTGQDKNFENRVEFFEHDLRSGDASILIKNTKVADSGNYSCGFPDPVVYHKLLVDWILRDRTGETVNGVLAKPSVTTINQNNDWAQLWCEVAGASPKPSVEWHDSSGNKLLDKVVNSSQANFILETIVYKAANYTCIATQWELRHKFSRRTYIHIAGSKNRAEGRKAIKFFLLLLLVVVDLLLP